MKTCRICQQTKPLDHFAPNVKTRDGRFHICKQCRADTEHLRVRSWDSSRFAYVYLMKAANGLCKIGITTDINNRLVTLRSSSPIPIDLIAYARTKSYGIIEQGLHLRFDHRHSHGEWFMLSEDEERFVIAELEELENENVNQHIGRY